MSLSQVKEPSQMLTAVSLGGNRAKLVLAHSQTTGVTGAFAICFERTETGVVSHNVAVEVVTAQKLLQALPGHCGLRSQRTSELLFFDPKYVSRLLMDSGFAVAIPAPWRR